MVSRKINPASVAAEFETGSRLERCHRATFEFHLGSRFTHRRGCGARKPRRKSSLRPSTLRIHALGSPLPREEALPEWRTQSQCPTERGQRKASGPNVRHLEGFRRQRARFQRQGRSRRKGFRPQMFPVGRQDVPSPQRL